MPRTCHMHNQLQSPSLTIHIYPKPDSRSIPPPQPLHSRIKLLLQIRRRRVRVVLHADGTVRAVTGRGKGHAVGDLVGGGGGEGFGFLHLCFRDIVDVSGVRRRMEGPGEEVDMALTYPCKLFQFTP